MKPDRPRYGQVEPAVSVPPPIPQAKHFMGPVVNQRVVIDLDGVRLVTLLPDGTVDCPNPDRLPEAAAIFWRELRQLAAMPPSAATPAQARRLATYGRCCSHNRDVHTHLRAGTDCSLCDCSAWRPVRWWTRWAPR